MDKLEAQMADLLLKKKKLTLMQGVGIPDDQDGNVSSAQALTGAVDYDKQDEIARKKMLISKMKSQG